MPFATAEDLPPEIIVRILDYFTDDNIMRSGSGVTMSKRELSLCALTCRYWAPKCQEHIFNSITLRSSADVYEFQAMLQNPMCHASRYTHIVELDTITKEKPWIHLAFLLLRPQLFVRLWHFALFLDGDLAVDSSSTVLASPPTKLTTLLLPRSLPPYAMLTQMILSNVSLPSMDSLVTLLSNLCAILCEFHYLSWPLPSVVRRPVRLRRYLVELITVATSDDWSLQHHLFLEPILSRGSPHFNPGFDTLGSCLHPLTSESSTFISDLTRWASAQADALNEPVDRCLEVPVSVSHDANDGIVLEYTQRYRHRTRAKLYSAPPLRIWCRRTYGLVDVVCLTAEFSPALGRPAIDNALQADWRALDAMAELLPSLEKVVLGFHVLSDLIRFRNDKKPELDYLQRTEKLRLARVDEPTGLWVPVNEQGDEAGCHIPVMLRDV